MTPEQAKFLLDVFLPSVQKEHLTTFRVLQAVPTGHTHVRIGVPALRRLAPILSNRGIS